jgi:hypothetical protein
LAILFRGEERHLAGFESAHLLGKPCCVTRLPALGAVLAIRLHAVSELHEPPPCLVKFGESIWSFAKRFGLLPHVPRDHAQPRLLLEHRLKRNDPPLDFRV